jgi:hypothetical protein
MIKSLVLILLVSAFLSWNVLAEEENNASQEKSVPQKMGDTVKKGGEAAGRGIEKGVEVVGQGLKKGSEATVKGVKKAEGWVGKEMQKGGEKLEKAAE